LEDLRALKKTDFDLVQLTNDEGGTAIVESIIYEAIQTASNLIDGYIGGRYTLPLAVVPSTIRDLAITIAVKALYTRRMASIPEDLTVYMEYKEAIKTLERIQNNKFTIPELESGEESVDFRASKKTKDRVFTKEVLDQF
jgi:phage gp36-like protein